ncbi:MAG: type II toxin-antitoxin system RelE/ParE family toxin [Halothiobacillus sp.]
MNHNWYIIVTTPILDVRFYRSESGNEPVRDWLRSMNASDRKVIGEDIKTVQFGWPLGMPLVRKMGKDLWEIRTRLDGRIARVLFTSKDGMIVLLHGFIKKSDKTPADDLAVAQQRMKHIWEQSS